MFILESFSVLIKNFVISWINKKLINTLTYSSIILSFQVFAQGIENRYLDQITSLDCIHKFDSLSIEEKKKLSQLVLFAIKTKDVYFFQDTVWEDSKRVLKAFSSRKDILNIAKRLAPSELLFPAGAAGVALAASTSESHLFSIVGVFISAFTSINAFLKAIPRARIEIFFKIYEKLLNGTSPEYKKVMLENLATVSEIISDKAAKASFGRDSDGHKIELHADIRHLRMRWVRLANQILLVNSTEYPKY